jgi:hypothetical protein
MNHRSLLGAGLLLLAGPVLSAEVTELEYALRAGATFSDNIELLPSGQERNSTAAAVGLVLSGTRPEGRLRYDVAADVAYYKYLTPDLDSQLLGRAALTGAYDFVPDTFTWNAGLLFDQIRQDFTRPFAPGNQEEVVTFTTGPTLRARFGSVAEGQLDARYTRTAYGDQPFDNETVGGRALVLRRANPRSALGVGVSFDDVSYVSSSAGSGLDYQRKEAFGRMEIEGARSTINLEAGVADVSGSTVDDNGLMVRALLTRRVAPTVTAFLNGVREYPTSSTTALTTDPTVSGGGTYDTTLLTTAARLTTSVEGGLRLERTRAQGELAYRHSEEKSLIAGVGKRDYDELRGRVTRLFTPRTRGSLFAAFTREDFSLFAQKYDETVVGAQLGLSLGRALGIDLRIQNSHRDGSGADDYSELSGGVFFRYSGQL